MKKILVTTHSFYPSNTPRAFRITALAEKWAQKGHNVTVITENIGYDYNTCERTKHLNIITTNASLNSLPKRETEVENAFKPTVNSTCKLRKAIKSVVRKSILYLLPDGHLSIYGFKLLKEITKLDLKEFDVIVSNSNPFVVHLATAIGMNYKKYCNVSIAETGDPYFYSQYNLAFYQKQIESWALNKFTHITVPIEEAISDYSNFNLQDKVKIVPHGFDFTRVKLKSKNDSKLIKFAFAGRLYKEIRNPTKFLDFLLQIPSDFEFTIFTDLKNTETIEILKPYVKTLEKSINIQPMIPRDDCIYELSAMDFLVNFSNETSNQNPSKLIDYALTGRPVINIANTLPESDKDKFKLFLNKDYSMHSSTDIDKYNIENVSNQFEKLFHKT